VLNVASALKLITISVEQF